MFLAEITQDKAKPTSKKKEHQALHFEIIVDENQVPNYNQVVTS